MQRVDTAHSVTCAIGPGRSAFTRGTSSRQPAGQPATRWHDRPIANRSSTDATLTQVGTSGCHQSCPGKVVATSSTVAAGRPLGSLLTVAGRLGPTAAGSLRKRTRIGRAQLPSLRGVAIAELGRTLLSAPVRARAKLARALRPRASPCRTLRIKDTRHSWDKDSLYNGLHLS